MRSSPYVSGFCKVLGNALLQMHACSDKAGEETYHSLERLWNN